MPTRLGLTGGIGSGKSTVAEFLRARGAAVIDADAIARASTQAGGAAMPAITTAFGPELLAADGSMDRDRMRALVFQQPDARARLEAIVHPFVSLEIARQASASRSACTVFDVPLLVESPRWRPLLDRVLVVDCSMDTQIARVMQRNGWNRAAVEAVIQNQSPRHRRMTAADMVLFNDGIDLEQLGLQVGLLASRFGL